MNTEKIVQKKSLLIDFVVDRSSFAAKTMLILTGSFALTLSAKAAIPFGPVPMTFQLFALLLIGITMGRRLGTLAVLAYLAQGACGLPVFYDMVAGPLKFIGPTAGYLFGMIPAVWIAGYAAEQGKDRSFWKALPYLVVAHQTMYACGVLWLVVLSGSWEQAFMLGYFPFIGFDILKFIAVAAVAAGLWRLDKTCRN